MFKSKNFSTTIALDIFSKAFLNVFTKNHLKIWLPCLLVVKTILFFSKEVRFPYLFFNLSGYMESLFGVYLPSYSLIMCVSMGLLFGVLLFFLYLLNTGVLKRKISFFLCNKNTTIFTFFGKLTGKILISSTVVYFIFFLGIDLSTAHISLLFSSFIHIVLADLLGEFLYTGWWDTVLDGSKPNRTPTPTPNPRPDGPSTPVLPQDRDQSDLAENTSNNTPVETDVRSIPVSPQDLNNLERILNVFSQMPPNLVSHNWFNPSELSLLLDHIYQIDRTTYDKVCKGSVPRNGHHAPYDFKTVRNTAKFRSKFRP